MSPSDPSGHVEEAAVLSLTSVALVAAVAVLAALVAAGLVSVILFPAVSLRLLRGRDP